MTGSISKSGPCISMKTRFCKSCVLLSSDVLKFSVYFWNVKFLTLHNLNKTLPSWVSLDLWSNEAISWFKDWTSFLNSWFSNRRLDSSCDLPSWVGVGLWSAQAALDDTFSFEESSWTSWPESELLDVTIKKGKHFCYTGTLTTYTLVAYFGRMPFGSSWLL